MRIEKDGMFNSNDFAPPLSPLERREAVWLKRSNNYLYWASRDSSIPSSPDFKKGHVGRVRLLCNGDLDPATVETLSVPVAVAVEFCPSTNIMYVVSRAPSSALRIYDLNKCGGKITDCLPAKEITPGQDKRLFDAHGLTLSPGCTSLQVGTWDGPYPVPPSILNYSLSDPKNPTVAQYISYTLETPADLRHDEPGGTWFQYMDWFDGRLYTTASFGNSAFVFEPTN